MTRHFHVHHLDYIIARGYVKDPRIPDPNEFVLMFLLTSQSAFQTVTNPWFIKLCQASFTPLGRTQLVANFLPGTVLKMQAKVSILVHAQMLIS